MMDIPAMVLACTQAMDAGLCFSPPAPPTQPREAIAGIGSVSSAEAYRIRSIGFAKTATGWAMCLAIPAECQTNSDGCKVLRSMWGR